MTRARDAASGVLTTLEIDGATDIGADLADADLFIVDDGAGGTNRKVTASRLKTYAQTGVSSAADDITAGDAAVTIATTSGNITLDAQANDSDIIFKGTDGGSDTTFLTIDGSAAGAATFNDKIVATELDISGDVDIDGTLEADAITVNSTALSSVIAGTTVTLASTATALANARTIGGVSFDGSANITPTTFAAATFSGDVNICLLYTSPSPRD